LNEGARCRIEHLCGEKFDMLSHMMMKLPVKPLPIKLTAYVKSIGAN